MFKIEIIPLNLLSFSWLRAKEEKVLAEVLCKHKAICKYRPLPSLGFCGPHARLPQY